MFALIVIKNFMKKNSFLPKRARKTNSLTAFIIDKSREKQSMKDVAKLSNVSVTTVLRLLPYFQ